MKRISFKHVEKILPIIGIILFIYIISDIGIYKILETFLIIPPYFFIIALVLFVPKLLIATKKWKMICDVQKIPVSYKYLAHLYLISIFYGSVTPSGIGFHIRMYFLARKTKVFFEKCIANSIVEGTLTLIAGTFLSVIGSLLIFSVYPSIFPILFVIFLFYVIIFVFFMGKKRGGSVINYIIKPFIPSKYKTNIQDSIELLYEDLPKLKDTILPFFLDCIVWIIAAIQVYILSLNYALNIPFHLFILISITSVIVATMVPITIGGIGVREGVFVLLLAPFGVPSDVAFVLSFAGFLVKNLIPGVIGMIFAIGIHLPVKSSFDEELDEISNLKD